MGEFRGYRPAETHAVSLEFELDAEGRKALREALIRLQCAKAEFLGALLEPL